MQITSKAEAQKFGRASADSAIAESGATLLPTFIAAYRENIRDTLVDIGASEWESEAWSAYDAEISKAINK